MQGRVVTEEGAPRDQVRSFVAGLPGFQLIALCLSFPSVAGAPSSMCLPGREQAGWGSAGKASAGRRAVGSAGEAALADGAHTPGVSPTGLGPHSERAPEP